jgi:hypothetical protein
MKIVMAIGAAIILGIVSAIVFLLFLIPVAGLGAVAVIGGMAAGLTWNLYTITLAVVVGSIAIFSLLYIMSLVSVPAVVFFPAYYIYFFDALYPALSAVLYPAPPPVAPPPPDPPPLLPAPEPIG